MRCHDEQKSSVCHLDGGWPPILPIMVLEHCQCSSPSPYQRLWSVVLPHARLRYQRPSTWIQTFLLSGWRIQAPIVLVFYSIIFCNIIFCCCYNLQGKARPRLMTSRTPIYRQSNAPHTAFCNWCAVECINDFLFTFFFTPNLERWSSWSCPVRYIFWPLLVDWVRFLCCYSADLAYQWLGSFDLFMFMVVDLGRIESNRLVISSFTDVIVDILGCRPWHDDFFKL